MAILLIRIENTASLPLNEFYDYNGHVYALSRRRESDDEICIDLEDFYEASIDTDKLSDIPVIFVAGDEKSLKICGWYQKAAVSARSSCPTFFLEGNIIASSSDAVLLPDHTADKTSPFACVAAAEGELNRTGWVLGKSIYEVVETEDFRFPLLKQMLTDYRGANTFLRYPYLQASLNPTVRRSYEACTGECEKLALELMEDRCSDIRSIKQFEAYAKQAVSLRSSDADGYYYLAMASYQLGFNRQGMKAIEKALKLEPSAADLHAQKAYLLASMGYLSESAAAFHTAYKLSGEEDYLLWEGKTYLLFGKVEESYDTLRRISDQDLLKASGIDPQSLEKKWRFINFRGFHFRNPFRR